MGLHLLSQESEAMKKELAMTSNHLMASHAGLKELEAEGSWRRSNSEILRVSPPSCLLKTRS